MKVQRWRFRTSMFKVGFCGVLLSLVLCCISCLAPAWQNSGGLWIHNSVLQPLPGWMQAVRVLVTVNMVGLCATILLEVYQDLVCRPATTSDNCLVELLCALAGLSGLTGVILFAAKAYSSYPSGEGPFGPCNKKLFWAWGLHLVGSITSLLSAAILAYSRRQHHQRSQRQMQVAVFKKTAPVGLNPYFVARCAPAVLIVDRPVTQHGDSHV